MGLIALRGGSFDSASLSKQTLQLPEDEHLPLASSNDEQNVEEVSRLSAV